MKKAGHEVRTVEDKGLFKALCACHHSSGWVGKGEAETWEFKHMRLVEQAMAHLRGKNPSMKDQHDYYLSKATDPNETRENRALWQQLADELRPRVPVRPASPTDADVLPFDVTYQPKKGRATDRP